MKLLKRILIFFVLIVVTFVLAGLALPDRVHVERSIVIDAPPQAIYPYVSNFRQFNRWSPWFARDPQMEQEFAGPESGVGASVTWRSDDPGVGSGSQRIVEAAPPSFVRSELDFGGRGTAGATFSLDPVEGGATRVTWGMDTRFGMDLAGRYFGLLLDRWVGADYQAGLASLKRLAEES